MTSEKITQEELDILYAKLNHFKALVGRHRSHLANLQKNLHRTLSNQKHRSNKEYHIDRIQKEIKETRQLLSAYETGFMNVQKAIFEYEVLIEEQKLALKKEQLVTEQLETLEFIKRLKFKKEMDSPKLYDIFISHSSEDKEAFVRPLANALKELNIKVWYDEFELKVGDSLRERIDAGLKDSRFGIVVLSNSFFSRNWTKYELNGFVSREMNESKVILPIWHKVTKDEVINFSPTMADKVALNSSIKSINEIAIEIANLLNR